MVKSSLSRFNSFWKMHYINSTLTVSLSHIDNTICVKNIRRLNEAPVKMDLNYVAWLCSIICFAQVCSFPTNCMLQKHMIKRSHALLDSVGGLFPEQCLEDDVSVPFPQNVFESNSTQRDTGVEKAIYQTLQNIDTLFENDGIPDKWNEEKLDGFLHSIYRQINDSRCILSKPEAGDELDRDAALKVYFETLSANMKQKDFSYCAWEVVRKEVLRILDFMLKHNTDIML